MQNFQQGQRSTVELKEEREVRVMNELTTNTIETAIGTENITNPVILAFKDGVSEKVQTAVSAQTMEMISAYNNVTRGYFQLLSPLARFIKSKGYQQLKDIKTPSQFLIKYLGCSKGTASELSRVATKFYSSNGEPSKWCECFTYSELTKLLDYDDDDIQGIKDKLGDGEKHTRAELIQALTDYNAEKELEKQGIEVESEDEDNSTDVEPKNVEGNANKGSTVEQSETADNNPKSATEINWTEKERVGKLIEELTASSKGKKSKAEMQEIAFRALNTIKEYVALESNPFN